MMRKNLFFSFFGGLSCLLFACGRPIVSGPAAEEGWVSSGGELIKGGQNPWWLKNTTVVNYCVQIDKDTVSASPERIAALIEKALGYWKSEFARRAEILPISDVMNLSFNEIGVGAQEFRNGPCTGNEDLRFQFGLGTLTSEQIAQIRNPQTYIALAVRTYYDEKQMKGKGFVYISSDKGTKRPSGDSEFMETPWQHDTVLSMVLIHELGHVFGIPHMGEKFSLMSQDLPEIIVSKLAEKDIKRVPLEDVLSFPFFLPPSHFRGGHFDEGTFEISRRFLGLPPNPSVHIHLNVKAPGNEIQVAVSEGAKSPQTSVGVIKDLKLKSIIHMAIVLHLPPSQEVFPVESYSTHLRPGPFRLEMQGTGIYESASGTGGPVFLNLTQAQSFQVYGVVNGKLEELISAK